MIPLNNNIHLYDRERNADALRLHEDFSSFFAFACNLYEDGSQASAELAELDDFSLSQLLSLCRDISVLYKLPVSESMPESIPEDSPIRYVAPNETDIYEQARGRELAQIVQEMNRFTSEVDRRYRIFERIANTIATADINTSREGGIITQIEDGVRSAAELLPFLGGLLPFFPNARGRETIYGFIEEVQSLFQAVDMPSVRAGVTDHIVSSANRQNVSGNFANMANSARELSGVVEARIETITESEVASLSETAQNESWVRRAANTIRHIYDTIYPYLPDVRGFPPVFSWEGNSNRLQIDSYPPKVTYTRYAYNGNELTLFLGWNPEDNHTFFGGANFAHRSGTIIGLAGLNLDATISRSGDNGIGITFDVNALVNRLTRLGLGVSIENNDELSLRAAVNRGDTMGFGFAFNRFNTSEPSFLFDLNVGRVATWASITSSDSGQSISAGAIVETKRGVWGVNVAATRNGLDSAGISVSGNPTGRFSFEGSLELPFSVIFPNQPTVSLKIKFPF
jgi:hypothetical protein